MEYTNPLAGSCLYYLDKKIYKSVSDHPDFKYLCESIRRIMDNRDNQDEIEHGIKGIKNVLSRLFGGDFLLTIADAELHDKMFVCNVFPPLDDCVKITNLIINEGKDQNGRIRRMWDNITTWNVDLDSNLFFGYSQTFNPAEIAAIIIYNIERVKLSHYIIDNVNFIIRAELSKQTFLTSKRARSTLCRKLFAIPLYMACMWTNYAYKNEDLHVNGGCITTDHDLNNTYNWMVEKLIAYNGNGFIDQPTSDMQDTIRGTCTWLLASIDEMRYSTKMIKDTLRKLIMVEHSYFVKNMLIQILSDFGMFNLEDVATTTESYNKLSRNKVAAANRIRYAEENFDKKFFEKVVAIDESAFFDFLDKFGSVKKVSQIDIDVLRVSVQRIHNVDDKIYILESVDDQLKTVDCALTMLESTDPNRRKKVKQSKQDLLNYKKQLNEIRELIFKAKTIDQELPGTITIEYPKGYDG